MMCKVEEKIWGSHASEVRRSYHRTGRSPFRPTRLCRIPVHHQHSCLVRPQKCGKTQLANESNAKPCLVAVSDILIGFSEHAKPGKRVAGDAQSSSTSSTKRGGRHPCRESRQGKTTAPEEERFLV